MSKQEPLDQEKQEALVLVLGSQPETLASVCDELEAGGIAVVGVSSAAEAAQKMRERSFDLLLVDAAIARPGVADLLARVREVMPQTGRAVFEVEPGTQVDLRDLIHRAAPCAFFMGVPPAEQVKEVLRRHRSETAEAASSPAMAPARKRRAGFVFGAGTLFQTQAPSGNEEKPRPQATVSPAETRKGASQAPVGKSAHAGMDWELNYSTADMTAEVSRVLAGMLEEPDVRLPVLPQAARAIRNELARPNASFERIAEIVSLDPSMSARILEVANSPLYAGVGKIRNLQQAAARIGMRETRNILLAVATQDLFTTREKGLAALMSRLWLHSLVCAYANEIMAKELRIKESSDFFMMGLLHDIGKLAILHLIQIGYERGIWTKRTISDALIADLFLREHNSIGRRLMEKWEYDKSFQDMVFLHNDDVSKIRCYSEPVVVTYYSNLLTRKMGLSLLPCPEGPDPLGAHDFAQAMNMTPETRDKIEKSLRDTLSKIQESYK
jgi:HD-like signal output (HDOD) protein/CheY-like chemotaxis protein